MSDFPGGREDRLAKRVVRRALGHWLSPGWHQRSCRVSSPGTVKTSEGETCRKRAVISFAASRHSLSSSAICSASVGDAPRRLSRSASPCASRAVIVLEAGMVVASLSRCKASFGELALEAVHGAPDGVRLRTAAIGDGKAREPGARFKIDALDELSEG